MRETLGTWDVEITSPARSDNVPIVALTSVPAASASSMRARARELPSGDPSETRRLSSTAARTTSSRFPTVWPSAEPTGSVM